MGPSSGATAALAIDAGALDSLKRTARDDPKRALTAAATQFEALFVQMLLKSMREALPQDGPLQSDSSKMYTGMFDQQVAQQMAARGLGLRQMLERQLAPALAGRADSAASPVSNAAAGSAPSAVASAPAIARKAVAQAAASPAAGGAAAAQGSHAKAGGAASVVDVVTHLPQNVRAFIERMRPHAEAAARAMGVPADLLLAQAGLETGWGKAQPLSNDGSTSHNLFGIKAGRSWNGAVAAASTTEYVAGALVRTVERFRAYGTYTEAVPDFAKLITGNARYAGAVKNAADPVAYARSLQRGGYASDPQYADKLVRAIRMVASYAGASTVPPASYASAGRSSTQVLAATAVNPSRTTEG
jgi:flagellar protein FlgJ